MRTTRNLLLVGGGLVGAWFLGINVGASYLMRRRLPDPPDSPINYGIDFQEVQFESRDETILVGRWIPAQQPKATIIICHGQEGNMDGLTPIMVPLYEAGFNVFLFDFRAHGRSEGDFVSFGMREKEDLLGAIDFIHEKYNVNEIGVLGFSMGAAATLIAAALSDRICAIVADSSYVNLRKTLQRWGMERGAPKPLVQYVSGAVLALASVRYEGRIDQSDPLRWVPHIGPRPILFIYGGADPYVSQPEVSQLASVTEGPVEMWIVDGVGHRGAYPADPAAYMERVVTFFQKYL